MIARRPLQPRERRLIALFLLVLAIGMAWLAIVAPILAGFANRSARRAELSLRYRHDLNTIASIPRLRRTAERERAAASRYVIPSRSVEDGRAWLVARVQQLIELSGGEFRGNSDAESATGWARVRVTTRVTLDQLVTLLTRAQNDPPFLLIDLLSIDAGEATVTGASMPLEVTFEAAAPLRPVDQR